MRFFIVLGQANDDGGYGTIDMVVSPYWRGVKFPSPHVGEVASYVYDSNGYYDGRSPTSPLLLGVYRPDGSERLARFVLIPGSDAEEARRALFARVGRFMQKHATRLNCPEAYISEAMTFRGTYPD